jgi:hypothetical protein
MPQAVATCACAPAALVRWRRHRARPRPDRTAARLVHQRLDARWLLLAIGAILIGAIVYVLAIRHPGSEELTLYGNIDIREVTVGFRVAGQDAAGRPQLAREYAALGKALGGGWQVDK